MFSTDTGEHLHTFAPPPADQTQNFGWSFDVSDDWVIVGAPWANAPAEFSRDTYVFDAKTRLLVGQIFPDEAGPYDRFGNAIAIDANTVFIGASYDTFYSDQRGSVFVFNTAGPCTTSDLAPPFGLLDLADIDVFIAAFLSGDPTADVVPPSGIIDLGDIDAFIAAFLAGCP